MQTRTIKFNGHTWDVVLRDEADESVVNEIFKFKEYKAVDEIIKNAKSAILDVGGHRGFFTLYCRSLNATVPIIAIEPEKNNIKAFEEHMKTNTVANVALLPAALAAAKGKRELIIAADSHNHELQSLDARITGEGEKVQTLSLADVIAQQSIKNIDLIKMDIEGAEYEIIDSLPKDMYSKIRNIVLEYHRIPKRTYRDLEEALRKNGFGVQVFPSKFDTTMGFIVAHNKR